MIHLPLEPLQERYTEHLHTWERLAFEKKSKLIQIFPRNPSAVGTINQGAVLDSVNRPKWAMKQINSLLSLVGGVKEPVHFSDFYHNGLDALPYSGQIKGALTSFCWAQTFDCYDFTRAMMNWMRPWEVMAFEIYDLVFVAHPLLKELIIAALPHVERKVSVVGLPFNSEHVRAQLDPQRVPDQSYDCVYSSRWDIEKNPSLFMDVVESNPNLNFLVCTGSQDLRGTDTVAIDRAKARMVNHSNLTIKTGCTKAEYYGALAKSRVQINTSSQDWISFTLLEALTFGCFPLYPNHRSFPDTLLYHEESLYDPDTLDAINFKLRRLCASRHPYPYAAQVLAHHDAALERMADQIVSLR